MWRPKASHSCSLAVRNRSKIGWPSASRTTGSQFRSSSASPSVAGSGLARFSPSTRSTKRRGPPRKGQTRGRDSAYPRVRVACVAGGRGRRRVGAVECVAGGAGPVGRRGVLGGRRGGGPAVVRLVVAGRREQRTD